jgi:hypothetical protein
LVKLPAPAYRQADTGRACGALAGKEMEMGNSEEVEEENRKIRYLRFLVDFSILSIQQDDVSAGEALKLVEDVKRVACAFFPGKEETFEVIYRPRFNRVIQERFGTTAFIS